MLDFGFDLQWFDVPLALTVLSNLHLQAAKRVGDGSSSRSEVWDDVKGRISMTFSASPWTELGKGTQGDLSVVRDGRRTLLRELHKYIETVFLPLYLSQSNPHGVLPACPEDVTDIVLGILARNSQVHITIFFYCLSSYHSHDDSV